MKRIILILIGCLGIMIIVNGQEKQAEQLLSEAIYQEEVNGELEAAIKSYQLIIDQYPENRKVAAEAYFHLGMCYEKMGNQEAKKAYQEILQKYGEQKELVAKAQERLNRLMPITEMDADEPEGIRIRQIWQQPYLDFLGTVSSDGRSLAYVYWGNGDVAVHNLITGEDRILTHIADLGDSTHFAQCPAISKDGSKIAYYRWNPYHTFDLCLIDVDDPSPRIIYRQEGMEVYPRTWLSDNELIAIRQNRNTETTQITSFNVLDGTFKDLKTFEGREWAQLATSPDEKFIAYDFADETNQGNIDINILPLDGSSEISLVHHPANDRVLGWVPGRKEFLFISDRSGTWDLWAVPVDDGKPSGPVKRIYTNIGKVAPMGFTENGDCFVGFSRRNFTAYIVPFNETTGALKEESSKTILGSNFRLDWSPDGQYLAYTKETEGSWKLTIQDLRTGTERQLAGNLSPVAPRWSPDGNTILVYGRMESKLQIKGYKGGLYKVNVRTGQINEIILLSNYKYNAPEDDALPISGHEWSSDGKSIFLLFHRDRLVKHDLQTGEEKILYKSSDLARGVLQLSPDGKRLLIGLHHSGEEKSRLMTIPAEGGKEKELCTSQDAEDFTQAIWSPDGKYIYFTERPEETNLWLIPAEGGKPQKVWKSEKRAEMFNIHPDGDQIAFSVRERTTEVRVIENLVQELERIDNISE